MKNETPKAIITNCKSFAASNPSAILSDNFQYSLNDLLVELKNNEVEAVIVADGKVQGAYKALTDAMNKRVNITLNGKEYSYIDYKKSFERDLILIEAVTSKDEYEMFYGGAKDAALFNAPKRMSEADYLNAFNSKGTSFSRMFAQNLTVAFKSRRDAVRDSINIDSAIASGKFNIEVVEASYNEGSTQDFISKNEGIHILAGEKGSGKTNVMKPLFDDHCSQLKFPVFVNSSRVLSSSIMSSSDDRFYSNAVNKVGKTLKGVFGVVNTVLLSNSFYTLRSNCKTFMVDEVEEVLNHQSGNAIGAGKIEDRANINKEFDSLVKSARTVVLADAAFSMNSLERIAKSAQGKKIFYHPQKSQFKKPVIKVNNEKQSVYSARQALINGEKVAVFCDGSHNSSKSKFNQVVQSVIGDTQSNSLIIDGAFMKQNEASKAISDINNLVSNNAAVFYNSAAKCGLSVVDADYKKMFAFSNKTVTPAELIQSFARFRNVEEVTLCLSDKLTRRLQIDSHAIAFKLMMDEYRASDVSLDECTKILADSDKMSVVDRISFINNGRNSYDSTVLVMLDIMGYEIQYTSSDKEKENEGRKFINEGEAIEKTSREQGIANAPEIDFFTYEQMKKDGEDATQSGKNMCEKFALSTFYKTDVTEALVDFDKAGVTRTHIKNTEFARKALINVAEGKEVFTTNGTEIVKAHMYVMLFETTGLNPFTFGTYKASDAENFIDHVYEAKIIINENTSITAKKAFEIAFPDAKLGKRAMSVVSSILKKEFGLKDVKNTKRREDGQFIYQADQFAEYEEIIARREMSPKEEEFVKVFVPYFEAKTESQKSDIQKIFESGEQVDYEWDFDLN